MKDTLSHLVLSASTINGTTVKNTADENLGEIKDIMLDTKTGRVAYAVLSVDTGFLNLGSKYFAIPWQAIAFDTVHEQVILKVDVNKEKLENSPGFDKDNWPAAPQTEFINKVHTYYGYDPYYV